MQNVSNSLKQVKQSDVFVFEEQRDVFYNTQPEQWPSDHLASAPIFWWH